VRDELSRFLDGALGEWAGTPELFGGWTPALDLYEDKDALTVRAEIPGMNREKIDISLHDGLLTVSGERKAEDRGEGVELHRAECFHGRFQRSLELPKPVQSDRASATYKDGVLTIVLPKTEAAKPKQIDVKID
jgi:HSP20 family protein